MSTAEGASAGGSNIHSKPPNILVVQPSRDSTDPGYLRVKEALVSHLDRERYVVYPLGWEEILQSPWRENCMLLVAPPVSNIGAVTPQRGGVTPQLKKLAAFSRNGGLLLSMEPELNRLLGADQLNDDDVSAKMCEVRGLLNEQEGAMVFSALNLSLKSSIEVTSTNQRFTSKTTLAIIDSQDNANEEKTPTGIGVTSSNEDTTNGLHKEVKNGGSPAPPNASSTPCVQKLTFTDSNGCAVASAVDLLPASAELEGMDVSSLVRLKKGNEARGSFLSAIFRGELGLHCSSVKTPQLTNALLVCSEENRALFLSNYSSQTGTTIKGSETDVVLVLTDYTRSTPVDPPPPPTLTSLTIITRPAKWQLDAVSFDFESYQERLKTATLGRTLLYTSIITSTQSLLAGNIPFCNSLPSELGVVCVAGQQTRGKGRGGNVWISPEGCMMFSAAVRFPDWSKMHSRMPLLQHLVALAVVHGIRTLPGYEDLPIRVKWPNDVYFKDQVKLGGILVSCFCIGGGSTQTAVIGCGINVCNRHPTMSVNDCIALWNRETGSSLQPVAIETTLACTLNCLEELLRQYERKGLADIEQLYYRYWLHSGSIVQLANHHGEEAEVLGIDEYGFLHVRGRGSGAELRLQPDGNTFDLMSGLIAMK